MIIIRETFGDDKSNLDSAINSMDGSMEGLKEMIAGAFTVEALTECISKTNEFAKKMKAK